MRPARLVKIPPLACGQSAPFDKGVNLAVLARKCKGVNLALLARKWLGKGRSYDLERTIRPRMLHGYSAHFSFA
jgi:hypothetical protein